MRKIDLTGEWAIYKAGVNRSFAAYVPGCIHGSLFDDGIIKDPFVGRNLDDMDELLQSAWHYEKVFVTDGLAGYVRASLHFGGFTAPAEVSLNGKKIAEIKERFCAVSVDVKEFIRAGKNTLCVKFSPLKKEDNRIGRGVAGIPWKARSFGLWGDVSLLAYSQVKITDVVIATNLESTAAATINVAVNVERYVNEKKLEVMGRVCYKGNILSETRCPLEESSHELRLDIKNPQLWWPASMGDQPLYEVTVDILDGRTCVDHVAKRVGLRDFEVREEISGKNKSKRFYINGKPLLLKGAEWVPADLYVARLTRVEYAHLVKSAVIANINLLRVCGGGVYENDCFYNLCDEYGVCVWQDVVVSDFNAEDSERQLRSAVQRLRHHPSLSIWYGGELDKQDVPEKTKSVFAELIKEVEPHLVWLPEKPDEIAFVNDGEGAPVISGYPKPSEITRYLSDKERNIGHPVCRFHMASVVDVKNMYSAFDDNFLMPMSFDSVLWLSQIQQGLSVKWAVERQRMSGSAAAGYIFSRLNDGWPCCSPSSLDYYGFWKAMHYMTRRFFSGYSVSGQYDQSRGQVEFYAFNDNQKPFKGEVCWSASLMDGSIVVEGSRKVSVAATSRSKPVILKVSELIKEHGASEMVLWIYLTDDQGNKVSWNVVLFCRPQELSLQPPRMRAEIRKFDENSYVVTLTSQTPAMWAWVTLDGLDAVYSDNFFCMEPAKPISVKITPKTRIKLDEFRQCFRIGSLRDTCQEKSGLMQMRSGPKKR